MNSIDGRRGSDWHCRVSASLAALALFFLVGCSGVGVVETSDPYEKLAQATQLSDAGRPARARQLTEEALAIFEANGDVRGQAAAYRQMGFFERLYGEGVILGSANAPPTTLSVKQADRSTSYFQRALALEEELGNYDMVSHLHYNIGVNFHLSERREQACGALNSSLAAYQEQKRLNPAHNPALPSGYSSYESFIGAAKQEAGC